MSMQVSPLGSLVFLAMIAGTSTPLDIHWEDLAPKDVQNDPLAEFSADERAHIEWIIHLRSILPEEPDPRYRELYEEMKAALPGLEAKGLDIAGIVADREALEENPPLNEALDGRQVRLAGYLLPLEYSGLMVKEFLA